MSNLQWANNAATILAVAISSTATSLNVAAGTGAIFPSPASGQYFKLTLNPASGSTPAPEIMHVTAVSTDTFTVVRAQEGTTAQAWGVGSIVQNLITAGTMNSLAQMVEYAGNPNGNVAGYAATSTTPPSTCWDTTDGLLWICTTSGSASTAGWIAQAPLASPTFTGTPAAPTPSSADNSTRLATTAYVQTGLATKAALAGSSGQVFSVANAVSSSQALPLGQAQSTFAALAGSSTQTFSVANAASSSQALPLGQAQSTFAALAGLSTQVFNVANAATSSQAVPLGQAQSTFAALAGSSAQTFSVSPGVSTNQAVNFGQFASSLSANGYQILPGGLILQWGITSAFPTGASTSSVTGTFPVNFPNNAFVIVGTPDNLAASTWDELAVMNTSLTTSGYTFYIGTANSSRSIGNTVHVRWFAIGN